MEMIRTLSSQHAVVIFSKTSCCMCHTIKSLFNELGASPVVHELDQDPRGNELEMVLLTLGRKPTVPAVFIGRELIGGANEVMALHLHGTLIPLLKRAGAIWL
ncbi:Glutaredoxin [Macleaya cordata]|uniref:Glutaredoxin n=1 Tax=Macleaya cordata TaxID=56857 RepID=A0A200Q1R0_MACCD|nr:Glutaredoxin [Macleaya cordata]